MTKTDQIIAGLIACGYQEVESNTRKARTFRHPDRWQLVFVGKRASLRHGKTYSDSWGVPEGVVANVIAKGKA